MVRVDGVAACQAAIRADVPSPRADRIGSDQPLKLRETLVSITTRNAEG